MPITYKGKTSNFTMQNTETYHFSKAIRVNITSTDIQR